MYKHKVLQEIKGKIIMNEEYKIYKTQIIDGKSKVL